MAWRDTRGSRRRLGLFLLSMVLGVAALVAINSFGENLERAVDDQARSLLGADLSFESRQGFPPEIEALIDSLGGEQSRRKSFASMATFPASGQTRLATVRALEGGYPFYGAVETDPPEAAAMYLAQQAALVDNTLMTEFGIEPGDTVQIGTRRYPVAGRLLRTPRETAAAMLFSPRVYVPLAALDTTLLQRGSRVEHEVYFKFADGRDVAALEERLRPRLRAANVGSDTVEEIQENWNEALSNLYRFLSLVGFVALLLGGLGVASAVHVYVKQRVASVAMLRCVGARSRTTVQIYLVQAAALGFLGALLGCLIGIGLQLLVPTVLADFLPVEVDFRISWAAVLLGMAIGMGVTVLFAALPLLAVRNVSPLLALRSSVEASQAGGRDPLRWGIYLLIGIGVAVFAIVQAPNVAFGIGYAASIGVVFGLLALTAKGIMWLVRRFFPSRWAYVWRQGLASLYRPNNQTLILILSLGLGTFLILTLFLVQQTLVEQVSLAGSEGQPNMVFFDIQPDQVAGVKAAVEAQGLPVIDQVPIVTMRLHSVQGRTITELRADTTFDVTWAHAREYRSSYRDYLTEAEEVVVGSFDPVMPEDTEVVPISIEQDVAEELGVGLGDALVFDVQGRQIETTITSIRTVDWQRVQTNFFVIFPTGVLERAPQFNVVMTRAETDEDVAAVQAAVVKDYPNVSSIDLSLILNTFEAIFSRIAFVVRFMALFSILTGLIVLAGAVLVSRYQRTEESVLLKTLGASRRQVVQILVVEYLFLGLFATLTGMLLALVGSWALATFVFQTPLVVDYGMLLLALVFVTSLTILIGLFNSRNVYQRPPLEVLRLEV